MSEEMIFRGKKTVKDVNDLLELRHKLMDAGVTLEMLESIIDGRAMIAEVVSESKCERVGEHVFVHNGSLHCGYFVKRGTPLNHSKRGDLIAKTHMPNNPSWRIRFHTNHNMAMKVSFDE